MTMRRLALWWAALLCSCQPASEPEADLSATALRFYRAVYACVDTELSEIASPDVRMSYPIFTERFGTPSLDGLAAVERFSAGFCRRWTDPIITVHEVIQDEGRVALVWSFTAVGQGMDSASAGPASWGGISVFHFDASGRVVAEFGEESTPGPHARMEANQAGG